MQKDYERMVTKQEYRNPDEEVFGIRKIYNSQNNG